MKKIMCDVDGVLLDFIGGFRNYLKEHYPPLILDERYWAFGLEPEIAWQLVEEYWASDDFYKIGLKFFPGALDGINDLANDFAIHIVTSLAPQFEEGRRINLKEVNFRDIQVIGRGKLEYILNKLQPDIAIEDKPKTIEAMVEIGVDVYLPNIKLTEEVTVGTKYDNWLELVSLIKQKHNG